MGLFDIIIYKCLTQALHVIYEVAEKVSNDRYIVHLAKKNRHAIIITLVHTYKTDGTVVHHNPISACKAFKAFSSSSSSSSSCLVLDSLILVFGASGNFTCD